MWPRHRFHSSKLRAEPRLSAGLGPGTGSRVDLRPPNSSEQRPGNGNGKEQSGKKLSPGFFKTVETAAARLSPAFQLQVFHLLFHARLPENQPHCFHALPYRDTHEKNRIPLLRPLFRSSEIWFPGWRCPKPSPSSEARAWDGSCAYSALPDHPPAKATGVLDSMPSPPREQTAGAADRSHFS